MAVWIALLRGVNVGGANRLAMADLRAMAGSLGWSGGRTLLQSGNLIFENDQGDGAVLEADLAAALATRLGLDVEVMVRDGPAWRAALAANPFVEVAREHPARLAVVALKTAPAADARTRLDAAIRGPERAAVIGREVFIHYPAGMGGTRLTPAVIDRALGVRGTARNWNTAVKIAEALSTP